jgi:hypothetical protein
MLTKTNTPIPLELRIVDLFGQVKTNIDSVSFRIYHRESGGSIAEDVVTTSMSGSESLWYYEVDVGLSDEGKYVVEYTITDDDAEVYIQTEELVVGYLESDMQFLVDAEGGKWEIAANQMIFYTQAGVELMRFNLYDSTGKPSMTEVYKRIRV